MKYKKGDIIQFDGPFGAEKYTVKILAAFKSGYHYIRIDIPKPYKSSGEADLIEKTAELLKNYELFYG